MPQRSVWWSPSSTNVRVQKLGATCSPPACQQQVAPTFSPLAPPHRADTLVDLTARAASAAEGVSGQLPWRVKGDAWEPSPEDEDEEDAEGLVEEDEEEEEEEEDGMPELDPSKQRLVAEGIADIMGGFKVCSVLGGAGVLEAHLAHLVRRQAPQWQW